MAKRYFKLKVSVIAFLLAVLTVLVGGRAKLEKEELSVASEDTALEVYPLAVQAYTSIEESEAEYVAPTQTSESTPTSAPAQTSVSTPTSAPTEASMSTPMSTSTSVAEQTSAVTAGDGGIVAPANGGYGENNILATVSDGQNEENRAAKINVAYHVRLTAYCPCEICCGYWALIRPVDEYGNKIVYTSTGALAVQGGTVAVNPRFIPHGSYVYVQDPNTGEWREYRATDTSGTMNHVDIYFSDHTAALHSGYGGYGTVYWSAEPVSLETLAILN